MSALTGTPKNAAGSDARARPTIRSGGIDRKRWDRLDRRAYIREYLNSPKPVIVLGAIDHWPARVKWTPTFFKERYGLLEVVVDGNTWKLGELIDRILGSTLQDPAPYLHNQLMADWPPELSADISPIAPLLPRATASFADDAIEVVVTRLDVGPEAVRASEALLSDAERQRASRFVFDRDRRRFTVARAWLRRLLSARLGVRPETVELVYGANGKPALARCFADSDLRFNVSHSAELAVYAFAAGREVGIDVEKVHILRDADDIASRFFSRHENEVYLALDPRDKPLGFFNCWTRKEAFIKALGDGLYHPLDAFDVSLTPGEPAKILRVDNTSGDDCGWRMESFSPVAGFVAAVVIENPGHRFGRCAALLPGARPAKAP